MAPERSTLTRAERLRARRRRNSLITLLAVVAASVFALFTVARANDDDANPTGATVRLPPVDSSTPPSTTAEGEPTGVPVPTEGIYFGAWRGPGPDRPEDHQASYEAAEQQIGRRYAIDRRFYRWGTSLPTPYEIWTSNQGRIPMISLRSADQDGNLVGWSSIANGGQDEYLTHLATGLREWGEPAFFILDAEPEGHVGEFGEPLEFAAAWRHIVEVFRANDVTNVSFTWTTQAYSFGEGDRVDLMEALYPGDDVVDWIAADPYNFFRGNRWDSLADEVEPWYQWAQTEHPSKPLALAEWGSKEDPADPQRKAQWFAEALEALRTRYPAIKAVVYFDEQKVEDDTVNDWRIDTSAESLEGFAAIARDPYVAAVRGSD
jgi:hypothetical protein